MSLPAVSIVVPTYARTVLLVEVVECFRRLTYQGPLELLILNDCEHQTLACKLDRVRILNVKPVPLFGDLINQLYSAAAHPLIIRCDDDDLFTHDMVSLLVDKLATCESLAGKTLPVVRNRHLMRWDGSELSRRSGANHHGALVRKEAWKAVGGLPSLPSDQADLAFWRRITPSWFVGRWHHETDGHMHTIYRNDAGRVHLEPPNAKPLTAAEFRARQDEQFYAKTEPRGIVDLIPSWSRDWQKLVDDFTAGGKASHG